MKLIIFELFIFFCVLSLIITASPPKPQKRFEIKSEKPTIKKKLYRIRPSFKRLDGEETPSINPTYEIEKSKLVVYIYEDYILEEHQFTYVPKDLPDSYISSGWFFYFLDTNKFEDRVATCKYEGGDSDTECKIELGTEEEVQDGKKYNKYIYTLTFELYNTQKLIINHSHKIIKTNEILYKRELARIPLFSKSKSCDYTYNIIPDSFKFLGFKDNVLTKESDKKFIFKGDCPIQSLSDEIRYAPEQIDWKASFDMSLTLSTKFTNDIQITFPRYYRGGKIENSYYRIFPTGKNYGIKENNIIYNNIYLKAKVPAANTNKLGIKLYTAFTNKLNNDFNIYFPESLYAIDKSKIDQTIKDKAEEIKADETYYPGKPIYYKIGKFVNNHIKYDRNEFSKDYTPKEIYDKKAGVCEHFTILYNEMLNAIGIETLYLTGWAFQNGETSGNTETEGHAWTAALIEGKWIELDATWGLFEGVPAGHILKAFFNSGTSSSWNEQSPEKPTYTEIREIQMITDKNDLNDPYLEIPDQDLNTPEVPGVEEENNNEDSTNKNNNEDSTNKNINEDSTNKNINEDSTNKNINEDSTNKNNDDDNNNNDNINNNGNNNGNNNDDNKENNKSNFCNLSLLSLILLYSFLL